MNNKNLVSDCPGGGCTVTLSGPWTKVAFKMQSPKFHLSPIFIQSKLLILLDFYFLKYEDHQLMTEFFKGQCMTGVATNTRGGLSFRKQVH